MTKTEIQGNIPPLGYPTENPPPAKKKWLFRTKKRGPGGRCSLLADIVSCFCCCGELCSDESKPTEA